MQLMQPTPESRNQLNLTYRRRVFHPYFVCASGGTHGRIWHTSCFSRGSPTYTCLSVRGSQSFPDIGGVHALWNNPPALTSAPHSPKGAHASFSCYSSPWSSSSSISQCRVHPPSPDWLSPSHKPGGKWGEALRDKEKWWWRWVSDHTRTHSQTFLQHVTSLTSLRGSYVLSDPFTQPEHKKREPQVLWLLSDGSGWADWD